MGYKISKSRYEYGNFTVFVRCEHCNHLIVKLPISFMQTQIGHGDNNKIQEYVEQKLTLLETNYCCSCGHKLRDKQE